MITSKEVIKLNTIYLVRGETVDITVLVKNTDGSAAFLNSYSAVFGSYVTGTRAMAVLDHELSLILPSKDTLIMHPGRYGFEIKIKDSKDKVKSILIGTIVVSQGFVQFE